MVQKLCKDQSEIILPSCLPRVYRQPHQAGYRRSSAGKTHFSGITEGLQKITQQWKNRQSREQAAAQGSESQDGAEHLPGHRLSHEAGQGEKNYCHRSHRGLRPTEAGTSGDENIARRAVDLLSAGSQGERRLRDVLCGAGGQIEKRRIAWPQMGGN